MLVISTYVFLLPIMFSKASLLRKKGEDDIYRIVEDATLMMDTAWSKKFPFSMICSGELKNPSHNTSEGILLTKKSTLNCFVFLPIEKTGVVPNHSNFTYVYVAIKSEQPNKHAIYQWLIDSSASLQQALSLCRTIFQCSWLWSPGNQL